MSDASAFLQALFPSPLTGYIELRFLPSGKKHWLSAIDSLLPISTEEDAYFGVCLRAQKTSGKAKNCVQTRLLWVDIDLADHPDIAGGKCKAELLQETAETLQEMKSKLLSKLSPQLVALPPLAIIDSGHGLQVYWQLESALPVERTIGYNKLLARHFGGDKNVTDIARILRLPDTNNRKNPARPLKVTLIHLDDSAFLPESALESLQKEEQRDKPEKKTPYTAHHAPESSPEGTHRAYVMAALEGAYKAVRDATEGNRNHTLNANAFSLGTLVSAGILDESDALTTLRTAARECGLSEEEISVTLRSGLSAGMRQPRDLSGVGKESRTPRRQRRTPPNTQNATPSNAKESREEQKKKTFKEYAELFAGAAGCHVYHASWKLWYEYGHGVYRHVDEDSMVDRLRSRLDAEGISHITASQAREILGYFRIRENIKRDISQSHWEIVVQNGILDLRTLVLREHTPDYFAIAQTACPWEPTAESSLWEQFLQQALPNERDRRTIQKYCGYCLTGDVSAAKTLLLIGNGGTGKSTFASVVTAALGGLDSSGLATYASMDHFRDMHFGLGNLVGKRACIVSELPRIVDWQEFKRITGGDAITINEKYQKPFKAHLNAKIIILSNIIPHLGEDATNNSLMRRFLPISWDVKPKRPDPMLLEKLTAPQSLAGILVWMVRGLHMLLDDGMRFEEPDEEIRREILASSNRLITFLDEMSQPAESYETYVTAHDLWASYREWCMDTGHKPVTRTRFGLDLKAAFSALGWDVEKNKANGVIVYRGLSLRNGIKGTF